MIVFDPKCFRTIELPSGCKATVRPKTVREVANDWAAAKEEFTGERMIDSALPAIVSITDFNGTKVGNPSRGDVELLAYPDLLAIIEAVAGLTHPERKNSATSSPS